MIEEISLNRFIAALEAACPIALAEVRNGRKQSHWMWYIFPQIQGLGYSETAKYYAIKDIKEAEAFLEHPLLGNRLIQICQALLDLETNDAHKIFGSPDNIKLKSSMTLFASVPNPHPIFQSVLKKFFGGIKDNKTVQIIESQS